MADPSTDKVCKYCEKSRPIERFELQKKKSGNHCRRNRCMDCRYKQQHDNIVRAVKKWSKSEAGRKNARERMARVHATPQGMIAHRVRCRMRSIFKNRGRCKPDTSQRLMGCSWAELEKHIEAQFEPGMSWENSSEWHIDHKMPLASFNLEIVGEEKKACHFSNLQPMWAVDNWRKSDRLPDGTRGRHVIHDIPPTTDGTTT